MDELLTQVPERPGSRFAEIVAITDHFCEAHFRRGFKQLCCEMATILCIVGSVAWVNFLGDPSQPLTVGHYRPAALGAEMLRRHYALQALLYTVALHRYLRWRVPGYSAERALAGVLYLFLRGMAGPETPLADGSVCGVFAWRPPPGLVAALSDALDRGEVS